MCPPRTCIHNKSSGVDLEKGDLSEECGGWCNKPVSRRPPFRNLRLPTNERTMALGFLWRCSTFPLKRVIVQPTCQHSCQGARTNAVRFTSYLKRFYIQFPFRFHICLDTTWFQICFKTDFISSCFQRAFNFGVVWP